MDVGEIHSEPKSYSALFNLGCFYTKRQKYSLAENILLKTTQQCQYELEKELAVILAQRAYVQHIQGLKQQALASYQAVLATKIEDPLILAITNNNISVLRGSENHSETQKVQKLLQRDIVQAKLNSAQKEIIEFNQLVLSSLIAKGKSQEYVKQYQHRFSASDRGLLAQIVLALNSKLNPEALQLAQVKDFNEGFCRGTF
jgi:hypothetical protein